MLAIDRWRKWRPSDANISVSPETEPPKPPEPTFEGFEGAISGQTQIISAPADDPEAWREDFSKWKEERCVCRSGYEDAGAISFLLADFAEWCLAHDSVPCQRATFKTLLTEAGFRCVDGMAAKVVLRVDLEAVLNRIQ